MRLQCTTSTSTTCNHPTVLNDTQCTAAACLTPKKPTDDVSFPCRFQEVLWWLQSGWTVMLRISTDSAAAAATAAQFRDIKISEKPTLRRTVVAHTWTRQQCILLLTYCQQGTTQPAQTANIILTVSRRRQPELLYNIMQRIGRFLRRGTRSGFYRPDWPKCWDPRWRCCWCSFPPSFRQPKSSVTRTVTWQEQAWLRFTTPTTWPHSCI